MRRSHVTPVTRGIGTRTSRWIVTPATRKTTNIKGRRARTARTVTTLDHGRRLSLITTHPVSPYLGNMPKCNVRRATGHQPSRMPRQPVMAVTRRTTSIKGRTARSAKRATAQATGPPSSSIMSSTRSIPYGVTTSRQHARPATRGISTRTRRRPTVTPAIRKMTSIRDSLVNDVRIVTPSGTGGSCSSSTIATPRTDYRDTIGGRNVPVVITAPCSKRRRRPIAMRATKRTTSTTLGLGTHARSAIRSSNGKGYSLITIGIPTIHYSASIAR